MTRLVNGIFFSKLKTENFGLVQIKCILTLQVPFTILVVFSDSVDQDLWSTLSTLLKHWRQKQNTNLQLFESCFKDEIFCRVYLAL